MGNNVKVIKQSLPVFPPPPSFFTVDYVKPQCPFDDNGQLIVTITSGVPPFVINIYTPTIAIGGTIIATQIIQPPVTFPLTCTFNDIVVGLYDIAVNDQGNPPLSDHQDVNVVNQTHFPYVPQTDGRAFGVDIAADDDENIIATGFFSEEIQFNQTYYAPDRYNIYLVKFDRCGNVIWDRVVGGGTGFCTVNAVFVSYLAQEQIITICGQYWGGKINFPSGPSLTCNNNYDGRDAFVAQFKENGYLKWMARIYGNGAVTAKDVEVDEDGYVYLLGDFDGALINIEHSSGIFSNFLLNLNLLNKDNYMVVYDSQGDALISENTNISTTGDDEASGLGHFIMTGTTDRSVFITGRLDGYDFLGQRWIFKPSALSFQQQNIYSAPALNPFSVGYFSRSVDYLFDPSINDYRLVFTGKIMDQVNPVTKSHPFILWDLLPPTFPLNQPLIGLVEFVRSPALFADNGFTSLSIDKQNGDLYFGGYIEESGHHPLPNGSVVNGNGDFIIEGFNFQNLFFLPLWYPPVSSNSGNAVYSSFFGMPEFFGITHHTFDQGHKVSNVYFTGSYTGTLSSAQLGNGISFPAAPNGSTVCYIARTISDLGVTAGISAQIKSTPLLNQFSGEGNNFADNLIVFPNPADDNLLIKINPELVSLPFLLKIYTIDSRTITEIRCSTVAESIKIPLLGYPDGLYFISLESGSGKYTGKFVKAK